MRSGTMKTTATGHVENEHICKGLRRTENGDRRGEEEKK
jgi:hypothetical protein